jgi:hypothetical protein
MPSTNRIQLILIDLQKSTFGLQLAARPQAGVRAVSAERLRAGGDPGAMQCAARGACIPLGSIRTSKESGRRRSGACGILAGWCGMFLEWSRDAECKYGVLAALAQGAEWAYVALAFLQWLHP